MDQRSISKNLLDCISPPNKQLYPEEHDQNDTIDCFTLPEIDITNDLSCCPTLLPGSVHQNRDEPSAKTTVTENRDANTCNILSPELPRPCTDSFVSEQMRDENVTPRSGQNDTQSTGPSEEIIRENKPYPISSTGVKQIRVLKHRTKADGECNDGMLSSVRYNLESSNVNKSVEGKRETVKPPQGNSYARHVFDPPKLVPVCAKSKQTPLSYSGQETAENAELPRSVVYIIKQSGTMYQLEFYTKNISFSPLYIGERYCIQPANDKKVQPPHYEYRTQSPKNEVSSFYVRQKYAVSVENNQPKTYKYALPPLRVYTDEVPPTRKRSISEASKIQDAGTIFFRYKEILFRVKCTTMHISQMKLPVSLDILERMAKLNMPTSESRKNKGVVIVRCGYDLMQVTFDMDDINLTRVEIKETVAVQTEDKMVYIREKSRITGRPLLLALPESTYFYRDPMRSIHRLHVNFQGSNVMPLWKYELMQNRLAERRGASEAEAKIEQAFKQTRGSRLYFEGLDCLITVQGGLMCCDISLGTDKYEALMADEYQSRTHRRRRTRRLWARKAKSKSESSFDEPPDATVVTQAVELEDARLAVEDTNCILKTHIYGWENGVLDLQKHSVDRFIGYDFKLVHPQLRLTTMMAQVGSAFSEERDGIAEENSPT